MYVRLSTLFNQNFGSFVELTIPFVSAGFRINFTGGAFQKFFTVPSDKKQQEIPYARVNHNKYMVTESAAYVGKCIINTFASWNLSVWNFCWKIWKFLSQISKATLGVGVDFYFLK